MSVLSAFFEWLLHNVVPTVVKRAVEALVNLNDRARFCMARSWSTQPALEIVAASIGSAGAETNARCA